MKTNFLEQADSLVFKKDQNFHKILLVLLRISKHYHKMIREKKIIEDEELKSLSKQLSNSSDAIYDCAFRFIRGDYAAIYDTAKSNIIDLATHLNSY